MDVRETMELLGELESAAPVSEWRLGELAIWPIVRAQIGWAAPAQSLLVDGSWSERRSRPFSVKAIERGRESARNFRRYAVASARDRRNTAPIAAGTDVVLLGDNVSRIALPDGWYDRILGPVVAMADELGLSTLVLEPRHVYRLPRLGSARWIQPQLDLLHDAALLGSRNARFHLPGERQVTEVLRQRGLDHAIDRQVLGRLVSSVRHQAAYFGWIFRRAHPRAGVLVDFNLTTMAFVLACRRAGIPAVEVQHGVQGPFNWMYSRWPTPPASGFSLLPSIYWTWSESEAEVIRSWAGEGASDHRAVVAGNPWAAMCEAGRVPGIAREVELPRQIRDSYAKVILCTLQPGCVERGDLQLLGAAARAAPTNWLWWLRPHPVMPSAEILALRALAEELRQPADVSAAAGEMILHGLLKHVDLHLTHSSSVTFEAEAAGVSTVFWDADGPRLFPEVVDRGSARGPLEGRLSPAVLASQAAEALDSPKPSRRQQPDWGHGRTVFESIVARQPTGSVPSQLHEPQCSAGLR